jgi:hypothetical protein
MTLERHGDEVIAVITDSKGIYKIGLGMTNSPDAVLMSLATEKYNQIKYRESNPLPPSYQELRAKEYPDFREYLDAKVKQASGDDIVIMQGQLQEEKYLSDCLAVKAKYPKV